MTLRGSIPIGTEKVFEERNAARAHGPIRRDGSIARASGPYRRRLGLRGRSLLLPRLAEVWLGDWVATDPTFNQYPADAAHIRFVVGGLAQQVEIIRLIGRLNIDVVTSSRETTP